MGFLNIPNTLTITRIIIIPVFVTAIVYKRYDYALYLFVTAALTDIFDGLLARLKDQKTVLGMFLDPLADKFLIVTSFIILSTYGLIPKWLAIIVISRDTIVITGWFLLYVVTGKSNVEPSSLGKATIWVQSIFIVYVLLNLNFSSLPLIYSAFQWITAVITIISGLHYIYRGLKLTHAF
ncbi:MAG: CDP-alcohol phosphatidyltransferase family protein [Thermodesulfovibrionales bacterium]